MSEEITGKMPIFGGSTGGLLAAAEREEKYVITWKSKKEVPFEMPTGGVAIMHEGENKMYFARKEQCLALSRQLKNRIKPKVKEYKIYRVFPSGETLFIHPADGVAPERANKGRDYNGKKNRRIGENPNPATIKFSGKKPCEID
ncbi:MAG: Photosystem I reaction center subunit II [Symploca sp. SIO2G7]|nr:Photosystem I reaction center subunit II [Symploca sp. SIO2G7]